MEYAIEYGESIGLQYEPLLGNLTRWGYEDNPREYASWNSPVTIAPTMTERRMRNSIQEHLDFIKHEGGNYIRPKVYCAGELKWATPYADAKLLFIFWG